MRFSHRHCWTLVGEGRVSSQSYKALEPEDILGGGRGLVTKSFISLRVQKRRDGGMGQGAFPDPPCTDHHTTQPNP